MFNPHYTVLGIRATETKSIRLFLNHHADKLGGNVLDWGCGTQPYRTLIEEHGGTYIGRDWTGLPGNIEGVGDVQEGESASCDTIVCTQVVQYVENIRGFLGELLGLVEPGGTLLLTGPANWPETEPSDIVRYTRTGIEHHLVRGGWENVVVHSRHGIAVNDIRLSLGWAAYATKPE